MKPSAGSEFSTPLRLPGSGAGIYPIAGGDEAAAGPENVDHELSDRDLMGAFTLRGDRAAFEALLRRWDRRIYAYLARASGDPDAAEDLRQEVFVRVFRHAGSYNPRFAFSTWLYKIAANVLSTWKVRRARREVPLDLTGNGGAYPEPRDPAPDPRQRAAAAQAANGVRRAIDGLDVAERELLLLRFEMDMSYREIAEIHDAPETTIKSRIYKLLERLRDRVEPPDPAERTTPS